MDKVKNLRYKYLIMMLKIQDLQINFPKVRHTCPECKQDLAGYVDRCIVISSGNCPFCGKRILEQDSEKVKSSDQLFQFAELEQANARLKKQGKQDALILVCGMSSICVYLLLVVAFSTIFDVHGKDLFYTVLLPVWLVTAISAFALVTYRSRKIQKNQPHCCQCKKMTCDHWDISSLTGRCWFCANELFDQSNLNSEKVFWKPTSKLITPQPNWKQSTIFFVRLIFVIYLPVLPFFGMMKLFEYVPINYHKFYLLFLIIFACTFGYFSWKLNKTWIRKLITLSHIPENQCPACKNFHANGPLAMATKRCPDCRVQFVESEAESSD